VLWVLVEQFCSLASTQNYTVVGSMRMINGKICRRAVTGSSTGTRGPSAEFMNGSSRMDNGSSEF
jgi:hypothetical protein